MTKQSFISELAKSLEGIVSNHILNENLVYYRTYIEQEVKKGFTEQQVLEELGDPRLIARTIIDASGIEYSGGFDEVKEKPFDGDGPGDRSHIKFTQYNLNKWYWKLLVPVVLVVVMLIVIALISVVFGGFFYLFAVLVRYSWVIFLIACLYWFFKGIK